MTDISGNQFVYDGQRISGVVDLDAYVIGPREWELSTLEMGITAPAAFRQGYECYRPLPPFAPFRRFYRFWMYLNEPGDGYDAERLAHFMQQTIHFA
jgi:fructosamine-3-kinase